MMSLTRNNVNRVKDAQNCLPTASSIDRFSLMHLNDVIDPFIESDSCLFLSVGSKFVAIDETSECI